ncbi:DUF4259 domain-containing protein [Streptomyces nigra]
MGTWGTGPFDSDLAADFVDELEGLTHQQVIDVLERAFHRVTDSRERVDGGDGAEAIAAGALVASTLPDSPIVIDPDDGPAEPLPALPPPFVRRRKAHCTGFSRTDLKWQPAGWTAATPTSGARKYDRSSKHSKHPLITNRDRFTESEPEPEKRQQVFTIFGGDHEGCGVRIVHEPRHCHCRSSLAVRGCRDLDE